MPMTMPTLLRCVEMYKHGMNEIIIQSSNIQERTQIIEYLQTSYLPNVILFQFDKISSKFFEINQQLQSFRTSNETNIYICRNFQCQSPLTSFEQLKDKFERLIFAKNQT